MEVQTNIDFDSIYKQYHNEIVSFVNFKIHNNDIAEEIVNDSFLKLYNNLNKFDPEKSKLKTWLFTIVNNTLIDYQRMLKKNHLKTSIDINNDERRKVYEINDNSNTAFETMCNKELSDVIIDSINKISGISMEIAKLFFLEHLSYDEISQIMEIPIGTVKGSIYRIRLELQESLRRKNVFI